MGSPIWENIFRGWNRKESETVLTLKQVPVFNGLSSREMAEIEKIVHNRSYNPNEFIFKRSAPGVGMYIIMKGKVEIVIQDQNNEDCALATLGEGDFFGELALLDEQPRSAAAIARDHTTVLGFFRPDLLGLLERKPSIGIKILFNLAKIVGERLRKTNEALQEALKKTNNEN